MFSYLWGRQFECMLYILYTHLILYGLGHYISAGVLGVAYIFSPFILILHKYYFSNYFVQYFVRPTMASRMYFVGWDLYLDFCYAASEAAVHISYTGKILISLTASLCKATMPRAHATIVQKLYSWEAYRQFGVQKHSNHYLWMFFTDFSFLHFTQSFIEFSCFSSTQNISLLVPFSSWSNSFFCPAYSS